MLHRVDMDVIHMGRLISFVPDRLFPISPLPDAAFPLPQTPDRPSRLPCNPSGKARLDFAHTPGKSASPRARSIGNAYGPAIRPRHRYGTAAAPVPFVQRPAMRQFRPPTGPSAGPADLSLGSRCPLARDYGDSPASRHPLHERRVQGLALGIVLAQVLADQLKPFPAGQACGVLALACWSTPYVC